MRKALLSLVLVSSLQALSQSSIVKGKAVAQGSTEVNSPYSQYLQIFVVFPPNPTVNTTFLPNVMTQAAIDGVTLPMTWANIETTSPDTTPCNPAPSDTCQPDPIVPMYHHYVWKPIDGGTYDTLTYPGIWGWFKPVGTSGVGKKVNLILDGEDAGNPNIATPRYVTDSSWTSLFTMPYAPTNTYARQDVVNAVNCSGVPWTGTPSSSISYAASTQTITVSSSSTCCSSTSTDNNLIQQNDLVWTTIPANSTCATGSSGQRVTAINSSTSFSYTITGCTAPTGSISPTNATFISAFQSWLVPYEWPYKSALKALWAATFAHFHANYNANLGSGMVNVGSQLGYIRPGESAGGEAFPYCVSNLSNSTLTPAPYTYVKSGSFDDSTVGWLDYYSEMLNWAASQTPYMTFFAPLNTANGDSDYGTQEANTAAASSNGGGIIDGFGSQGLSILDTPSPFNGCSASASNWCDRFDHLYGVGMSRELQQISLSNEQNSTSCPGCGIPPAGNSGDLRVWLPFAVQNHLTVLELYTLDAGLAYDPSYCQTISLPHNCNLGYATSGTFLSGQPDIQGQFMNDVGQGFNCPGGGSGAGGTSSGTCSYALCLNDAHGLHPRPQLATSCMSN